jgi:predicted membrane metal-binding protein
MLNISSNRFSLVTCLVGLLIITNLTFILQCWIAVLGLFCLLTYFICQFLIGLVAIKPLVLYWTVFTFNILCILYVVKRIVDFIELKYNSQDGTVCTFIDFISRDFSFLRNRVQSPIPRQSDDLETT